MLELGAGQGRDSLAFLRAGLGVTALDYAAGARAGAVDELRAAAAKIGRAGALHTAAHDVREPLPLPDASVDAVYSHMLFSMALTTLELERLAGEVHRALRPGGLHVYTVRHTGDAHYGTGTPHGDNMFENGGFIVHFFDRALVDRLDAGFTLLDLTAFEEGDLPRRLWRVTARRGSSGGPSGSARAIAGAAPSAVARQVRRTGHRRHDGGVSLSVTIRYIEGCPQRRVAHDHLRAAAREVGIDLDVQLEPVVTHQDAQRLGFAGSPTVLLEGTDPFAQPGAIPALACRLYATPAGPAGAPTFEQLVAALRERRAAGQVRAASRHGGGERLDAPRPPRDGRQPH